MYVLLSTFHALKILTNREITVHGAATLNSWRPRCQPKVRGPGASHACRAERRRVATAKAGSGGFFVRAWCSISICRVCEMSAPWSISWMWTARSSLGKGPMRKLLGPTLGNGKSSRVAGGGLGERAQIHIHHRARHHADPGRQHEVAELHAGEAERVV